MDYETTTIHLTACVTCHTVSVEGDEKCPKCGTPMNRIGVMEHRTEKRK